MIYLIKRATRPAHHKAPYHPVILCHQKGVAKWEAGWTGDEATVWTHENGSPSSGWLMGRWKGFDINYGYIIRGIVLPDGTHGAICHKRRDMGYDRSVEPPKWLGYTDDTQEPWSLLAGATWWSSKKMPPWIEGSGVLHPADSFTRNNIIEQEEEYGSKPCLRGGFQISVTVCGANRSADWPEWWTGKGDEWK
jgi:hypothetical protein